jgi:hypothetical protein
MVEMRVGRVSRVHPSIWGAAALVLLPLAALKLADPAAWAFADLPFALVMVAVIGLALECALWIPQAWAFRAGAALALGAAVLLVAGNLAVGFAGPEDNPISAIVYIVPCLALAGALAARFRTRGLALAMVIAAAAQLVIGGVAWANGYFTGPLTAAFIALWLASALAFRRAGRGQGGEGRRTAFTSP